MQTRKIKKSNKLVYGVGLNDADYEVQPSVEGKKQVCPFYRTWSHMLERCYSARCQEKHPSYIGCSVSTEWLLFSNFKAWMEKQDWKGNHLDKDMLNFGNRQYSKESCIFIPAKLNTLLLDCGANRGPYPIGVDFKRDKNKFQSRVQLNGKRKYLGIFSTPQEAHAAWQLAKKESIFSAALEQTDSRLKEALLLRCTQLQYDIDGGLETIKL